MTTADIPNHLKPWSVINDEELAKIRNLIEAMNVVLKYDYDPNSQSLLALANDINLP